MSGKRSMLRQCWLPRSYVLVIAEKPKAARRIAEYLSENSRPIYCSRSNVPFWIIRMNNSYYVIGSAAGHLYGLATDMSGFPVFTYYWAPLWRIDSSSRHTKRFLSVLEYLAKNASFFINACDYDIEGSVIGFLIIKFLGDVRRARRVKFSALTPSDIRRAFRSPGPLDWEMIEAGLARHELDWLWGINVSRALMEAVRRVSGRRVILSAGRVQSPTLREVVERTWRRNLFVPLPRFAVYVSIDLGGVIKRVRVVTVDERKEAVRIADSIRTNPWADVVEVKTTRSDMLPPPPFNLGDLQSEAARIYGYDPHYTQDIAEQLYLDGLISYPRTNSQKIPPSIDIASILRGLHKIPHYSKIVEEILSSSHGLPRPRNGAKDDPAHPAIHPTGIAPARLRAASQHIYDLIVRRFLASMMKKARIVRATAFLLIARAYRISISGGYIEEKGWLRAYPFLEPRIEPLPILREGARLRIVRVETRMLLQPPIELHTKLSLVKWMESNGIGTEATRARIVKLLFDRGYLAERKRRVYATDVGIAVAEILKKYFPALVDIGLTRHFEKLLESIRAGETNRKEVVNEAKELLAKILNDFKQKHIVEAGEELSKALGLIKPAEKCMLCSRESYRDGLCRHHYDAYVEVLRGYREWSKRMEGLSPRRYLSIISRSSYTGIWAKDVATAMLEGRLDTRLLDEKD